MRSRVRQEEAYLRNLRATGQPRTEWDIELERDIADRREQAAKLETENMGLRMKLMPVIVAGLLAALGILFSGIASSPTSRLLVQAGAQPAGAGETEARRILENLSIGAGLPVPKLYVIETSVPNAFAAGMDPEHAVVAVTRGALTLLDHRELEGVFAHELSHIGNQDIRLNTIVATVALFLRIPYLMFRRELSERSAISNRSRFSLWRFAVSPFGLYVFFVAPVVAALIRAAVSREREFLADADAALLTRYPEGLTRALAKIGGAGAAVAGANPAFSHFYFANPVDASRSWFNGNLMATHPPLAERIDRLIGYQGQSALPGVEKAIEEGRRFKQGHATVELDISLGPQGHDELAALNQGNIMGRVYRLAGTRPVSVYEMPVTTSMRVATVEPGSLIVAFDDPGAMRQINTANQSFGYISRAVKLQAIDNMIPAEVYDPALRAAAEAKFAAAPAPAPPAAGLTQVQLGIAVAFGVGVFGLMILLLWLFG
jgi:heat shock protein HtpX